MIQAGLNIEIYVGAGRNLVFGQKAAHTHFICSADDG